MIVAALALGNDTVRAIDTVSDNASGRSDCWNAAWWRCREFVAHGVDHPHGVVPERERGHDHGVDHTHAHGHGHGHVNSFVGLALSARAAALLVLFARSAWAR